MLRIDRRLLTNLDWTLISLVLAVTLIGIMSIYSATRPLPGATQTTYHIKQAYWLCVGLVVMVGMLSINYKWLQQAAPWLYWGGVVLLIAVMVAGRKGMGAQRWLSIGPVSFQPSELFKLSFIIFLARQLSMESSEMSLGRVVKLFVMYAMLPMAVILKQPDLGTALVVFAMFGALVFTKGVGRRAVALALLIALVSVPFVGSVMWDELKPYQKKRITAFINPEADPEGISYHVQQSKVAVGSGGFIGKGYMKGTQGPFRFLPERHTDFVFSVFAEEWGFLGGLTLAALYILIILRGIDIARKSKDEFGRLTALGVVYMLTMYCFVNMGMTMGIVPVVGIPLPFMSYGGTALVANFMALGLLVNIRARRFELFY